MSIEVSIKGKIFESVKAVARTFNVPYSTIRKYSKQYQISYEDAVDLVEDNLADDDMDVQ